MGHHDRTKESYFYCSKMHPFLSAHEVSLPIAVSRTLEQMTYGYIYLPFEMYPSVADIVIAFSTDFDQHPGLERIIILSVESVDETVVAQRTIDSPLPDRVLVKFHRALLCLAD